MCSTHDSKTDLWPTPTFLCFLQNDPHKTVALTVGPRGERGQGTENKTLFSRKDVSLLGKGPPVEQEGLATFGQAPFKDVNVNLISESSRRHP